jgi:putative peptidoglycan lipid II flippase
MQRGEFGAAATEEVAWALGLFALGLTAHGAIEILARVFYALHDTWVPALAAVGAVVLNVLLGLSLPPLFARWGMLPHGGLALANSLAALMETAALLLVLQRRIGRATRASLSSLLGRPLLATLGMSLVVGLWLRLAPESVALRAVGGVGLGLVAHWGGCWGWKRSATFSVGFLLVSRRSVRPEEA